jgi:murein DD-endopeptidase MepM/ murein hydrolase activator NlpD
VPLISDPAPSGDETSSPQTGPDAGAGAISVRRGAAVDYLKLTALIGTALALGLLATFGPGVYPRPAVVDSPVPDLRTILSGLWTTDIVAPEYTAQSANLTRGSNLTQVLIAQGAGRQEAYRAVTAVAKIYDVRRIREGTGIDLVFEKTIDPENPRMLDKVVIAAAPDRKVIAQRAADGSFTADNEFADLSVATVRAGGVISDSLYLSARRAGLPDSIIADTIRIFSYDVDFQREVRNGDRFEVFFERHHDEQGQPVKEGNILFASMTLSGKRMELFRHAPSDTKRTEYFNEDGRTARKALMRTPIDGARLTSGFGKRRHPILGYRKMHRGLDFGARRGTPIMAAGDGVIDKLGRNGGYGKYIRIRHNGTYSTAYAHMNGYRKGLRRGKRVKQGQTIGYVGSTGRSTGPHLHYEVLKNGRQMNPLKVKMPTGRKLKGKLLAELQKTVATTRTRLAEAPIQTQIASAE